MLRCKYQTAKMSDSEPTPTSLFKPYALWYCQRAWYVVGVHTEKSELRQLKLNRFVAIDLTKNPFNIPDDFSLREHLGNAWRMIRGKQAHEVEVEFEPEFANTASETRWHPTQQERWEGQRVRLTFTVEGLDEIVWWILGYGPGATVIKPPELRKRVGDLARATAKRYGRK